MRTCRAVMAEHLIADVLLHMVDLGHWPLEPNHMPTVERDRNHVASGNVGDGAEHTAFHVQDCT